MSFGAPILHSFTAPTKRFRDNVGDFFHNDESDKRLNTFGRRNTQCRVNNCGNCSGRDRSPCRQSLGFYRRVPQLPF